MGLHSSPVAQRSNLERLAGHGSCREEDSTLVLSKWQTLLEERKEADTSCSFPQFLRRKAETSQIQAEGRTNVSFPRIIEVVCTVLLGKKNPPSQLASSKLCNEYFQGKVTVYNVSLKDNYFCHLFWNLSSGIRFKTWIPKKENCIYWLFFFFLPEPWTVTLNALCFKKNPHPSHSNLIIHSFHKLVYSHRYGQVLFWARKL